MSGPQFSPRRDTQLKAQPQPIPYSPGLETTEENEAEIIEELVATLRGISERMLAETGQALRSVHAKSHGLLHGEVQVLSSLPPILAQGVFAEPGRRYQAAIRLSTPPGDILTDAITLPRGMAIKLLDVEGSQLDRGIADADQARSQDFVMVNAPAFQTPGIKQFLANLKLLAKTTNRGEGLKAAASAVFRGVEKVVEAFGGESAKLKSMGGHPQTHPLGETFFTVVPLRYGEYVAKLCVRPFATAQMLLRDAVVDLDSDPDGLRRIVNEYFAAQAAEWEICVQLCTDLEAMPIEDASVPWPEERSPYIAVARLRMPIQPAW
ncbi:MAG TPA: catalase family protein, partial [Prosthecobacter sp.]